MRPNLLLLPTTFAMLALAAVLWEFRRLAPAMPYVVAAMLLFALAGAAYTGRTAAQSFNPDSVTAVIWNSEFLYGRWAGQATIPPERYAAVQRQLAQAGVRSREDLDRLEGFIKAGDLDGVAAGYHVFVPALPAFQP